MDAAADRSVTHNYATGDHTGEPFLTQIAASVTSREMSSKPISSILGGFLFEMGYGDMESGLWAEMLFNRKFAEFPPYHPDRDWWYHLREVNAYESPLTTDWTKSSWYHSAYEHNAWFASPGPSPSLDVDTETALLVNDVPDLVTLRRVDRQDGHSCLLVENRSANQLAGVAQEGKYIRHGMSYAFKGTFSSENTDTVYIKLFRPGDWSEALETIVIGEVSIEPRSFSITFEQAMYEGWAVLALWIPPGATLEIADLSLMPRDHAGGWRQDCVEAVRSMQVGALRWPGGCFASWYDWRNGIGARDSRLPENSLAWGGWIYHDVGTLEYLDFCERTGATPFICVNMFHPLKEDYTYYGSEGRIGTKHGRRYPQFTDLQEGARLAADWVAYCNAEAGTHPMADLRAAHGRREPYRVTYWELDNELFRWFNDPLELADYSIEYAKQMKAVDPSIQVGICTYGDRLSDGTAAMVERAGAHIDFLADRGPFDANLSHKIGIIREYNAKNGTDLGYIDSEFFVGHDRYTSECLDRLRVLDRNIVHATWGYALSSANALMMWQRYGGDVRFTCFNSFANDHFHSAIDTPREGAFLRYTAEIYRIFARSVAMWPVYLEGYEADAGNPFQIQAAWDLQRERLVIYLFNALPQVCTAILDLSNLNMKFDEGIRLTVFAAATETVRSVKEPNPLARRSERLTRLDTAMEIAADPFSFTEIVLTRTASA